MQQESDGALSGAGGHAYDPAHRGWAGVDIYRFFHPHHNPRLHSTGLRQQELSELEQAAAELLKALERAQQRTVRKPVAPVMPEHFADIIKAMRFVENSLQTVCDAHPGDAPEDLEDMILERSGFSGWENWTALLNEQLAAEGNFPEEPAPPLRVNSR